ncbi:MAG: HAD family hydrolase [Bdellovibrionales bacterium]
MACAPSAVALKAVFLDLGNVVLELNIQEAFEALGIRDPWKKLSEWNKHHLYETGKIPTDIFIAETKKYFNLNLEEAEFILKWNLIVKDVLPGVADVLKAIRSHVPLYALSNTNALHLEHYKNMKGMEHFNVIFASHLLGYRKPQREIFETVLSRIGIEPHEALFVDDMPENVQAAREVGLHAEVCMTSSEQLLKIFERYHKKT